MTISQIRSPGPSAKIHTQSAPPARARQRHPPAFPPFKPQRTARSCTKSEPLAQSARNRGIPALRQSKPEHNSARGRNHLSRIQGRDLAKGGARKPVMSADDLTHPSARTRRRWLAGGAILAAAAAGLVYLIYGQILRY